MSKILILSAHPDDSEFAMGGTISKLKRERHDLFFAIMSPALQIEQNKHILEELHQAMKVFGVNDSHYKVFDFRTRMFPTSSPEIQNEIFNLKKNFNPEIVFSPSENALHPDHSVVGRCVNSVFQETSIYVYEDIRGNHKQLISHWEELTKADIEKKIESLKCYKSQFSRHYFNFDKIRNLASSRGLQIGLDFAEGFEQIRTITRK